MFLNKNQHLPSPLQAIFTPNTDIHNHNTRHRNDPHIGTRRTNQLSRSFILGTTIGEASPSDTLFGIGLSITNPKAMDISKWRGTNLQGTTLMEIRAILASDAI